MRLILSLPFVVYLYRQYLFAKAYLLWEILNVQDRWLLVCPFEQTINDEFCDIMERLDFKDEYDWTYEEYCSAANKFLDIGQQSDPPTYRYLSAEDYEEENENAI